MNAAIGEMDIKDAERLARLSLKSSHYARLLVNNMKDLFREHDMEDDMDWIPYFPGSKLLSNGGWELVFVKTTEKNARTTLHIRADDEDLIKVLNFLKEQNETLGRAFEVDPVTNLLRYKEGLTDEVIKEGAFSLSSLYTINNVLGSKQVQKELGNRPLTLAMDAWA